ELLRERLVEAGLDVRPAQSRLHLQGWLMERWAATFEGRELCRGESPQIITGGADALDAPMEGLVYLRRAADAVDVVLYLPTIDPRGALEPPSTARRADARRSLAGLRERGWSIDDSSGAGFLARREVREDEDVRPGTWRGIAADIAALLEVPAGLGLLSSRVALAQLRTPA
ncbi:MAG: hypothetical protein KC486_32580, partial [Myxococcales bacterium]|nr:hypothetical protein [Myxococcales bacterium]